MWVNVFIAFEFKSLKSNYIQTSLNEFKEKINDFIKYNLFLISNPKF